ncbi:hypothetical protein [Providencia rettgeri]|uniref:hypothetical protein n=1 Tax=Providencia rettgeri TaxID=587 RepID=UPI0034E0805D
MSISKCNPILWKTDIKLLTKAMGKAIYQSVSAAFRKVKNTFCRFPLNEDRHYQAKRDNLQKFLAKIEQVDNSFLHTKN